jgi:hypothetical protein
MKDNSLHGACSKIIWQIVRLPGQDNIAQLIPLMAPLISYRKA